MFLRGESIIPEVIPGAAKWIDQRRLLWRRMREKAPLILVDCCSILQKYLHFKEEQKKKRIFGVEFKNFKNELMTYISEGSLEAFREFIEVGDQL